MKFSLNFYSTKNQFILFSLPQSNDYQTIKNLKINSNNYQIKKIQKGNKIVIFKKSNSKPQILFDYFPKKNLKLISENFSLNDYPIKKYAFVSNRFINGQNPQIKKLAKKIIGKEKSLLLAIKKIYYFTLEYLTYGQPTEGLYSFKQALKERITDCGGFSTFLGSLLQSQNIPTRLVVGFLIKKNIIKHIGSILNITSLNFDDLTIHAWLELLLPDKSWFPLDSSIEWKRVRNLTTRKGGFGYIPPDRLVTSFSQDFKLKINNKQLTIDLFQNPIYI